MFIVSFIVAAVVGFITSAIVGAISSSGIAAVVSFFTVVCVMLVATVFFMYRKPDSFCNDDLEVKK
jgi:quinol-cytochrome oxidoreductase complex cytochrome b subunit